MYSVLLAAASLLVFYIFKQAFNRPPNFPPGPLRLPIWGSYWLIRLKNYKFSHLAVCKLVQEYKSKIIGFYIGPFPTVVVTGHEAVKEVLTRPEFQGRPETMLTLARSEGKRRGIFFMDGSVWAEQRKFTLKHLREFGFGHRSLASEQNTEEEIKEFLALLRGDWYDKRICKDGDIMFPGAFYLLFINLLWRTVGGSRYERSDFPDVFELCRGAALFAKNFEPLAGAVAITPWLDNFFPSLTGLREIVAGNGKLLKHMKKAVVDHKSSHSNDDMRDFIDVYIEEIRKKKESGESSAFTDDQLVMIGVDFLQGAGSSIVAQMTFAVRCLLHYPEVQKKIQNELDSVIGRDRLPTLDDRNNLPYTEATLLEVYRRQTLLPLGVPHLVTEDTKLQGYSIPKNSLILTHFWSVHMDPEVWGDPENFRPERFLDENGKLTNTHMIVPFGLGKRECAGEAFARYSMFLILAAMLQNFTFTPKDPQNRPSLDDMNCGFTVSSTDFWVRVHPRN